MILFFFVFIFPPLALHLGWVLLWTLHLRFRMGCVNRWTKEVSSDENSKVSPLANCIGFQFAVLPIVVWLISGCLSGDQQVGTPLWYLSYFHPLNHPQICEAISITAAITLLILGIASLDCSNGLYLKIGDPLSPFIMSFEYFVFAFALMPYT